MCKRCNCWTKLSFRQATRALLDESLEFFAKPSFDELDDVKVCINRWVGSFAGVPSVEVFKTPLYDRKTKERMAIYGCIRSKRHLIAGSCPSTQLSDTNLPTILAISKGMQA